MRNLIVIWCAMNIADSWVLISYILRYGDNVLNSWFTLVMLFVVIPAKLGMSIYILKRVDVFPPSHVPDLQTKSTPLDEV